MNATEPQAVRADVDPEVRTELPGLELWTLRLPGGDGRTPRGVRTRLELLAGRVNGAEAIALRARPVPQAYRVLFRQLGVDPDTDRPPGEQAIVDRLMHGGYRTRGCVDDGILLAVVETGVPVWMLDADLVQGDLTVRPARDDERLGTGEYANDIPAGRLVVSDSAGPVAVLFGDPLRERLPTRRSRSALLFAVRAPGVPVLHVEEALWTAAEALEAGAR